MMILIWESSQQEQVSLMILCSHCLYLSESSGALEVAEVGKGQLVVHLFHSVQLGYGEVKQSCS